MEDKVYLLSLRELEKEAEAERLSEALEKRLDEHRLFLVRKAGTRRKMLESAAGGLLLQLAVQEYQEQEFFAQEQKLFVQERELFLRKQEFFAQKQESGVEVKGETSAGFKSKLEVETAAEPKPETAAGIRTASQIEAGRPLRINRVTLQQLLFCIRAPFPLQYRYGEGGKPYFLNHSLFFSLSHSGDYVLCAVSEEEIGADIQKMSMGRRPAEERLARRFFAKQEVELLSECSSGEEKKQLFYELWACKEALGKLTGFGISRTLALDMSREREKCLLKAPKGYQLAVCRRLDRRLANTEGK